MAAGAQKPVSYLLFTAFFIDRSVWQHDRARATRILRLRWNAAFYAYIQRLFYLAVCDQQEIFRQRLHARWTANPAFTEAECDRGRTA